MLTALISFFGGSVFRMAALLKSAAFVQFPFCLKVRGVSQLRRVVQPKVVALAICGLTLSHVSASTLVESDPKKSALVAGLRAMLILYIGLACNNSQIAYRIIRFIPVNMVNVRTGPLASDIENGAAVRVVLATEDRNFDVAVRLFPPGQIAAFGSSSAAQASEHPRLGAVVE